MRVDCGKLEVKMKISLSPYLKSESELKMPGLRSKIKIPQNWFFGGGGLPGPMG